MPEDLPKKGDPILFMDAETLPCDKEDPLWVKLSGNMEPKPEESIEEFQGRIEETYKNLALTGPLGRVWMIGYAVGSKDPVICQGDGSKDAEKGVLEEFWEGVKDFDDPWWVGHNISGYDIPFLQVRALVHGMPYLARRLSRIKAKPWEARVLDTQKLFPRTGGDRQAYRDWGLRGLAKLDSICYLLGIDQQEGVMGRNVYQAWLDGDQAGVVSHLDYDVRQVRDVFKKLWPVL